MHVCHLLEKALDAHWPQTGSHPVDIRQISGRYLVDIRQISTRGIYDFPALVSEKHTQFPKSLPSRFPECLPCFTNYLVSRKAYPVSTSKWKFFRKSLPSFPTSASRCFLHVKGRNCKLEYALELISVEIKNFIKFSLHTTSSISSKCQLLPI